MNYLRKSAGLVGAIGADLRAMVRREADFHRVRPRVATLFLTYRCNSRCSTCTFWKLDQRQQKEEELDFEQWKTIADKLHAEGIRVAEIFGGNVLIRKRLLIQVLQYLAGLGWELHMPTNQIGLDDEIAEAIVSCVHTVYVSTDGVGEFQDEIRGLRGSGERGEDAITRLRRLRADSGPPPNLVCNTTVSRYNVDELDRVAEYALRMGFDEIHFEYAGEFTEEMLDRSLVDGLRPAPYYVKQGDETILVDRDGASRLKRTLADIHRRYSRSPLSVETPNIDVLSETNLREGTIPHRRCYVERIEATVDPSGNLVACPFIKNYILGDLVNRDFDDVWNNPRQTRFRELQNSGAIEMCRHCILGVQRNPTAWTTARRILTNRIANLRYRLFKPARARAA